MTCDLEYNHTHSAAFTLVVARLALSYGLVEWDLMLGASSYVAAPLTLSTR